MKLDITLFISSISFSVAQASVTCGEVLLQKPSQLMAVEDVKKLRECAKTTLFERIFQQVIQIANGSAVLLKDPALKGVNLAVTARHVVYDLRKQSEEAKGTIGFDLNQPQTPLFAEFKFYRLLAPPLRPQDIMTRLASLGPKDDFAVGIISQEQLPALISSDMTERIGKYIHLSAQSPARIEADQTYFMIGFPKNSLSQPTPEFAGKEWLSVGKALTSEASYGLLDAKGEMTSSQKGAFESAIPFNPDVEFLVKAPIFVGFSGGGVFSEKGELVGIAVRGIALPNGERYVRVCKAGAYLQSAHSKRCSILTLIQIDQRWIPIPMVIHARKLWFGTANLQWALYLPRATDLSPSRIFRVATSAHDQPRAGFIILFCLLRIPCAASRAQSMRSTAPHSNRRRPEAADGFDLLAGERLA
jgi:hypothetical protein